MSLGIFPPYKKNLLTESLIKTIVLEKETSVNILNEMYKQVPEEAKAEGVDFYVNGDIFKEIEPLLIDGKFRGCKVINMEGTLKKALSLAE